MVPNFTSVVALALFCILPLKAQIHSSGLGVYDAGSTETWVYEDARGHIFQIAAYGNNRWAVGDITVSANAPVAAIGSSLTMFDTASGESWAYEDVNGHIWQITAYSTGSWAVGDVTALSKAPAAAVGSGLAMFNTATTESWAFEDVNGHVWQIAAYNNGTWAVGDITVSSGAPLAAAGSGLAMFDTASGESWAFEDVNGHVLQVSAYNNGTWGVGDVTLASNAPAAQVGSGLTMFDTVSTESWAFEDSRGHIWQISYAGGIWAAGDITLASNASPAAPYSGLAMFDTGTSTETWTYEDAGGNVWQIAAYGNNTWAVGDLTLAAGAGTAEVLYAITGQVSALGSALSGATLSLSGSTGEGTAVTQTAVSDVNGYFSFSVPSGGSYTISAAGGGYVFNPATFANLSANQTATFSDVTYVISGQVTAGSSGLPGATVSVSGSTAGGGKSVALSGTSDSNGNYSLAVPAGGTYSEIAAGGGYVFGSKSFSNLSANQTANFGDMVYTISGQVTAGSSGLSGATVSVSGSTAGGGKSVALSGTSDSNGNYSLAVPAGGTYSEIAAGGGYVFAPKSFSNLSANQTANFGDVVYTISGQVTAGSSGLPGATVSVSGSTAGGGKSVALSATSDSNGNYSLAVPAGGTYSAIASGGGYVFGSKSFSNLSANQTANFGDVVYTISGQVTAGSSGLSGATVSVSGSTAGGAKSVALSATTNSTGNYSLTVPAGGTYSEIAAGGGYVFAPKSFSNLSANQTANFGDVVYTISGQVTAGSSGLSGATVAVSGSTAGEVTSIGLSATTGSTGNYSLSVPAGGGYTVTPSMAGYLFSPLPQSFGNVSANQTASFAVKPTVTLTDVTRSSGGYQVGDSFTLQVSGYPGQVVTDQSSLNGAGLGLATYGNTNAAGQLKLAGIWGRNDVGSWAETWSIGGIAAAPTNLTFTVATTDAAGSAAKEYIYLNGKVVAIENPK